jgi:hypothetical protein
MSHPVHLLIAHCSSEDKCTEMKWQLHPLPFIATLPSFNLAGLLQTPMLTLDQLQDLIVKVTDSLKSNTVPESTKEGNFFPVLSTG